MLVHPDVQTATVISSTETTDPDGNTTTVQTTRDVPGCLLAPRTSTERGDFLAPAVIIGKSLYGPPDLLPLDADDWIMVAGEEYEVEGEPGAWGSAGVEVALKRTG